jgi:phosphonoacetaldehyde hydrolase
MQFTHEREFTYNRSYRGPIRAVIFDWAGTTMDFGCMTPAVVFCKVFKEKGVEISMEEARAPMGAHKKVHIGLITEITSVRSRWVEIHGTEPTSKDVDDMFESFVRSQEACLSDYSDLIPGTLEVVAECRKRGYKIGSTSGYLPAC